jgi:two-component system, OmpR family, alkaline phosphatase synthesis response regulator PhoP
MDNTSLRSVFPLIKENSRRGEKPMGALILVVDDDADWRKLLSGELCKAGFKVSQAATGAQALTCIRAAHFDLIILDVQLPDGDGYDVCAEVRQCGYYIPIIMISGVKRKLSHRALGLDKGADHYFHRPVRTREVVAQVKAMLRMTSALKNKPSKENENESSEWLKIDDDLRIHLKRRWVMVKNKKVELTPQEFNLLDYLRRNADRVVSANELLQKVWGDHSAADKGDDSRLKSAILRLRQKIEPDPKQPRYLITERGGGYYFCPTPKSD